ncbi:MAG: hypothetical protein H6R00_2220 [Proteobacteria bacterium]|nr:hypothetical protein [Pseudomonadota bacterium]
MYGGSEVADDGKSCSEWLSAAFVTLALVRARSRYPSSVPVALQRDVPDWLNKALQKLWRRRAETLNKVAEAGANAAVEYQQKEKGTPLTDAERGNTFRALWVYTFRGYDLPFSMASELSRVFHFCTDLFRPPSPAVRDMPDWATRGALHLACIYQGAPLYGHEYSEVVDAFLQAIVADLDAIDSGADPHMLTDLPLWPHRQPEWASTNWQKLKNGLSQFVGGQVWARWYEDRLAGGSSSYELLFAGRPEVAWNKGPEAWEAFLSQSAILPASLPELPSEEDQIKSTVRPAILVQRGNCPLGLAPSTSSYIGGLPALPPDLAWPRSNPRPKGGDNATALSFIAQIYLAELPRLRRKSPLPLEGILFFFLDSDLTRYPQVRVLFAPEGSSSPSSSPVCIPNDLMPLGNPNGSERQQSDDDGFDRRIQRKYKISFHSFQDFAFDDVAIARELKLKSLRSIPGFEEPKNGLPVSIHQILGYGTCIQQTPTQRHNQILLLQLSGERAFSPWHGDCGCVLQLWISRSDLRKRDFSRVVATIDSD